jgi:cysteine synthase
MAPATPLLDLSGLLSPDAAASGVKLMAKAEYNQPGWSMKDRIAEHILMSAIQSGKLAAPGGTVVAASSGNTGASVAMWCARLGLKSVIITDKKCSQEKKDSIKAYGAELIVAEKGQDYMAMEIALGKENPDWFTFDQYNNPLNSEAHYLTTGKEIWDQTNGQVSHFVMTASTGGTITGVSRFLKENQPKIEVVLADPEGSALCHYVRTKDLVQPPTKTIIEGAGKLNIPGVLDITNINDVIQVSDKSALTMCHTIARSQGLLVGGSSGVNVHAATELANTLREPSVVVTLLCDSGIKYLSKVFSDDWLTENGMGEVVELNKEALATKVN